MAQKKVADLFNKEYAAMANKIPQYIGTSDTSNIVDVTWRTDQVVQQFIIGLEELLKPLEKSGSLETGFVAGSVTKANLTQAVTNVIKNIKTGGGTYGKNLQLQAWNFKDIKAGSFFLKRAKGGTGLTFRFISSGKGANTGANDTKLNKVSFDMREAIYKEWLKKANSMFSKLPKAGRVNKRRTKAQGIITKHTNQAHEHNTTKGALMVGLLKELRPNVSLNYFTTTLDVIDQIESNIQLDYGRNFKKGKIGKYSFRYFIDISIRKNKAGSEESDISTIKAKQTTRAVNDLFVKQYGRIGAALRKISGSIPPDSQIIQDSIHDIVIPLTKGGKPDRRFKVVKKLSAKKFKKFSDNFEGKRGTDGKASKTKTVSVTLAASTKLRPQKKKRKDTDDLLSLRALINKRLGAEVRRNMGRPALENRTGDFSNSVELMDLRETKGGISGAYTYTLTGGGRSKNRQGVYQTFENGGRWPEGYNPKPLISKSIRNLALQYTEQKFTSLRRT